MPRIVKKILLIVILVQLSFSLHAQPPDDKYIDSLESVIPKVPDTMKVMVLLKLSREKMFTEGEEAVKDLYQAISLSREVGYHA